MKPQVILSVYLISFCQAALPQTGSDEKQRLLAKIENECGYSLSEEIASKITKSKETILKNNGATIEFSVNQKNISKNELIIKFNCHPQNHIQNNINKNIQATPTTASEVVKEQDSGGRYGRHIRSEQILHGPNWRGTAAHVDYIIGDNTKSPVTQIIACEENLSHPCIDINITPPLKHKNKIDAIINIIEKIRITNSTKNIKNNQQ